MQKWVEEVFFRFEAKLVWFWLVVVGIIILFDWIMEFRRLVRGKGASGIYPFAAAILIMVLPFAKQPLIINVEAHYLILVLVKVIEAVALLIGLAYLDAYVPRWFFSLLKRLGMVSPPDRERNGSDE